MISGCSTSATNVVTKARNCLRSGQFELHAWCSLVHARTSLFFLSMSGALFVCPPHCQPSSYVGARARARSNSNAGQGQAGLLAFGRFVFAAAMPRNASPGYHEGNVAPTPATPNPSIEGMPKRLRLLCTPHVKR
jgi:hypothetical protein